MNSYKIIFPYQSDTVHLASNEYDAFDKCFAEIRGSGRSPSVFVVLNLNTNTPYYLEINSNDLGGNDNNPDNPLDTEVVIQKDVRENSDTLSAVPVAPFDNIGDQSQSGAEHFNPSNPLNPLDAVTTNNTVNNTGSGQQDISAYIQRGQILEKRVDYLESEIVKMKMKVDYMSQVTTGNTNMNNLNVHRVNPTDAQESESCVIQ